MEVKAREYYYKNFDFLNKKLIIDESLKVASTAWKQHCDIYANIAKIGKNSFQEINKIYGNFYRFNYYKFQEMWKREENNKKLARYYTYAIYREYECPYYEFNKIWKDL